MPVYLVEYQYSYHNREVGLIKGGDRAWFKDYEWEDFDDDEEDSDE